MEYNMHILYNYMTIYIYHIIGTIVVSIFHNDLYFCNIVIFSLYKHFVA